MRSLFQDEAGNLWVGTDAGLHLQIPSQKGFKSFLHDPQDPHSLPNGPVFTLAQGENQSLWIGTLGGGLSLWNPDTQIFTHFRHDPENPNSLSGDRVWSTLVDKDGRLWVGTMDRGLNLWRPETRDFQVFRHSRNDQTPSSDKIWSIFEDRAGLLWFGTGDHGVNKVNSQAKPFFHLPRSDGDDDEAENLVVMALAPQGKHVWVGTWGQGLFKMDSESGQFNKVPLPKPSAGMPRMFVSLLAENAQTLWMGYWGSGLVKLNLTTMQETAFLWDFAVAKPNYNVIQIKPFQDKFLLSTYGDGVVVFDPQTQEFSRLKNASGELNELKQGNFFSALVDGNDLWLATVGMGLLRLDIPTMELKTYRKESNNASALPSDRITVLLKDDRGVLWIGTDGGGLSHYLPKTDSFQTITTKSGLPSNVINGVIPDGDAGLWVATNKGLDFFNSVTEEHQIFGPGDGLQLEYNAGVFARTTGGTFLFGGPKGLDYFYPRAIQPSSYIPEVAFSQFKVFNSPREVGRPLNQAELIELNYKDNFFAFEFAAMDFANPEKNRFRVKLEGVDKDWVFNGTRNFKEYTNLGGGIYTFKVQGSNGDGVWNEVGREIKIRIIPPFWKTKGFLLLAGLIALASIIGVVHYFERDKILRLESKQKEQWELNKRLAEAREVERLEIAQEIHDGPIQDLHAIQFQLSLAKEKNDYSNIGKYLLSVISSLRRLCGHLRPPALIPFGLAAAIRSLVDTMRDKYPDIAIGLSLENDGQKIPEDVRLALFRICQEALNNALQHSMGSLVKIVFRVDRSGINLIVTDDGKGFEIGDSMLAFSSQGHYGLLGISERVQAIGGTVEIKTSLGQGTRIKVLIPRDKAFGLELAAFA